MTEIDRVLKAVCQGYRTRTAIARAAKLTPERTGTYLTRLRQRDLITAKKPAPRHPKHYHLKDMGCLLADLWTGA